MRTVSSLVILTLLTPLCVGCKKGGGAAGGGPQTHEACVQSAVTSLKNAAAAFNGVTDAKSAEQAVTIVQQETQNLRSYRDRLVALGKPSSAQKAKANKHTSDAVGAAQAMTRAVSEINSRIQAKRFAPELANRLTAAVQGLGQAMVDFGEQTKPLGE